MALDPFISIFIRAGFALMFGLTSMHKLRDILAFKEILKGYNIVPSMMVPFVSLALPLIEIGSAVLLIWQPILGLISASGLLGAYALVMAFNIARGNTHIDCGCFWGGASAAFPLLTWKLVLRNTALIAILALAAMPTTGRALMLVDGLNLVLAICFGYAAVKTWFILRAVNSRMREFGHA